MLAPTKPLVEQIMQVFRKHLDVDDEKIEGLYFVVDILKGGQPSIFRILSLLKSRKIFYNLKNLEEIPNV